MTGAASETTTDVNGTDVMTYYVTSEVISHNGKPVTFPSSGYRDNNSLYYVGSKGYYWSSSASDGANAYNLTFVSSYVSPNNFGGGRPSGLSVLCVRE
jgi:hypothetical protein